MKNDVRFDVNGAGHQALLSAADARLTEFFGEESIPSGLSWWFSVEPFISTGAGDVVAWQATVRAEW